MHKLYYLSLRMPYWLLFLVSFFIIVIALYVFDFLKAYNVMWVEPKSANNLEIIFAITLGPIIETLINQSLFFFIFREVRKIPAFWLIFLSAIFFGLLHLHSVLHFFRSFAIGIIFMFVYLIFDKKKKIHPIISVTLLHILVNIFVVLKSIALF